MEAEEAVVLLMTKVSLTVTTQVEAEVAEVNPLALLVQEILLVVALAVFQLQQMVEQEQKLVLVQVVQVR